MREQRERLLAGVAEHERRLDEDVHALEGLRDQMRLADERATELRAAVDAQDGVIRDARRALDAVRALASELDVSRATAESDLGHLAQQAFDAVGVSLDDRPRGGGAHGGSRRRRAGRACHPCRRGGRAGRRGGAAAEPRPPRRPFPSA